jgi:hypothetical protein
MYICVANIMKVGHVCIRNSANPGTNKDCSYANTYSINTERPSKLKEKMLFLKRQYSARKFFDKLILPRMTIRISRFHSRKYALPPFIYPD